MKRFIFPELRQNHYYDCGATAMQAVLEYYGIDVNEHTVLKIAGTNRIGTSPEGLKKVARKFGLKYKEGKMSIPILKKYIAKKIPVIILVQAWKRGVKDWKKEWNTGHFVIPIGFGKDKIFFEDPICSVRTYLSFAELKERWKDLMTINGKRKKLINYGIAFYGKKPMFDTDKAVHMDFDEYDDKSYTYKKYIRFR
jgi:ABC-type bacteriocin/lantibiotic exporter with double-glycine peptidase domain